MTEAEELFATFQKLWRSGTNARLHVECHAGKVCASLHVSFNLPQPSPHRKRSSPSRLRRRARRAATRAQAAGQAVASEVITVDNSKNDETVDSLEEAGGDKPQTVTQTVLSDNQSQQKAVQARPTANGSDTDSAADVVEANEEEVVQPISKLNVLARPWPSGQQEEIHQDSKPIVRVPSNQCEKCGKTFGSNRALRNHLTREHEHEHLPDLSPMIL